MASCNVRHECDAALALLKDFLDGSAGSEGDGSASASSAKAASEAPLLKAAAAVGLGCAYAGSCREDILELLTLVLVSFKKFKKRTPHRQMPRGDVHLRGERGCRR